MDLIWSADTCWRLFEATGSVWAYLAYRRSAGWAFVFGTLSLN